MEEVKQGRVRVRTDAKRERDRLQKRRRRAEIAAGEGRVLRAAPNGKSREQSRVARRKAKQAVIVLPKVSTGTREYRRAIQIKFGGAEQMTKRELQAMLAQAAANTAALPVEGL